MTEQEFQEILNAHPDLTTEGFVREGNQQDLRDRYDEFMRAYDYLLNISERNRKTLFFKAFDTRVLTSVAQRKVGEPISQGAFIAAAIALGIQYERSPDGPYVRLIETLYNYAPDLWW